MGSTSNFRVQGRNHQAFFRDYVQFDWDWNPDDSDFEYYEVMIKHETGDPNVEITEERWQTEETFIWWKITRNHYDESIVVHDMITGETIDLDTYDVLWNVEKDRISINRNVFPSDWKGIEVKLSGTQYKDSNNPSLPDKSTIQSLPIQYWSFDE